MYNHKCVANYEENGLNRRFMLEKHRDTVGISPEDLVREQ
jgi:hypothetical protein